MGEVDKRRITDLDLDERAEIAHRLSKGYAQGKTYTQMGKEENLPTSAVKRLIAEHAAYVREARPDTKTLQEEEYRSFYGELVGISPSDPNFPALVRSTAIQARIQLLTRLDKLLGHEAPSTNVNISDKTLADVVMDRFGAGGKGDGVSPMDTAAVQDDVVDGEVVDDADDAEA